MLNYILRRLLLMIPTLIGMTLLLFLIVRFAPGLTSTAMLGRGSDAGLSSEQNRKAMQEALEKRMRLRDENGRPISLPMQYLLWLKDTLRGDLGESVQYHKPVSELIAERLPTTLALNLISTVFVYLLAIPGGMLAAARRGRTFDVWWSVFTLALYSLPVIWVGCMMLGFLSNPQFAGGFNVAGLHIDLGLPWFPSAGTHDVLTENMTFWQYVRDYMWHIFLPVICYTYGGLAFLTKLMRASILDNLLQDYARSARAKGLKGSTVMLRHIFRNSLIPLITVSAGILPGMLGGAVIIEQIFSIQGMGLLAYTAVLGRDLPIIQGVALVSSVLTLVSFLIVDLSYSLADPRVSYE
jgi:ABC-type dipeptide/oligopeptide/nickel transport system permease component